MYIINYIFNEPTAPVGFVHLIDLAGLLGLQNIESGLAQNPLSGKLVIRRESSRVGRRSRGTALVLLLQRVHTLPLLVKVIHQMHSK
jgi:hypothetical protein